MYDMLLFVQNICSLNVCYRNILAEEGEIDAAVLAVFRKAGVGGEVRFDGVFDDGDAFRSEQVVVEDGCREIVDFFQAVGGIGKDEVEFPACQFPAGEEGVRLENLHGLEAQFRCCALDEGVVFEVLFDGDDFRGSSRGKFVADAAGAGKEVEAARAFDVQVVGEHVEQVLFGEVRGGACAEVLVRKDLFSFVGTADYSHLWMFSRWMKVELFSSLFCTSCERGA